MQTEIAILQYLESIRTPFLNMLIETGTFSAELIFLGAIIVALYWCVDKDFAYKLVFIVLVNALLTSCIKAIVRKPRPFELGIVRPLRVHTASGYSFPSGHTSTAASFWGGAYSLIKNKSMLIVAVIMTLFVGFTRLYLGVHFPIDVIGGILVGIISIIIANYIIANDKWLLWILGFLTLMALVFPVSEEVMMSIGSLFGLVSGVAFEKKYVDMKVQTTFKNQIAKIIIGIVGTGLIYVAIEATTLDIKIVDIIKYILLIWYVTAGAPYIFKKLKIA
ncbi:phosphatase PAP2 family protein [Candidatus Epulonipiscium viviparus]|uniref:phosphatase PAP2 family protein n=1 Tax=Candidatus Epulonipiscium viviparus TaxID=420336 RepID=UPI00016C0062|nr:phosphatase PAP2 family protein [Candidatus Epulopiscium viviparus]